jgi:hypothetical protein
MVLATAAVHNVVSAAGTTANVMKVYEDSKCANEPVLIVSTMSEASQCTAIPCMAAGGNAISSTCGKNIEDEVKASFKSKSYLNIEIFAGDDCKTLVMSTHIVADGKCHSMEASKSSMVAKINEDKSVQFTTYSQSTSCEGENEVQTFPAEALDSKSCNMGMMRAYLVTSEDSKDSSSNGSSDNSTNSSSTENSPKSSSNTLAMKASVAASFATVLLSIFL